VESDEAGIITMTAPGGARIAVISEPVVPHEKATLEKTYGKTEMAEGQFVAESYTPIPRGARLTVNGNELTHDGVIRVAEGTLDRRYTNQGDKQDVFHAAYHALRDLVLTRDEIAQDNARFGKRARATGRDAEEISAETYARYVRAKNAKGRDGFFDRIRAAAQSLRYAWGQALQGNFKRAAQGVSKAFGDPVSRRFEAGRRGELWQREPKSELARAENPGYTSPTGPGAKADHLIADPSAPPAERPGEALAPSQLSGESSRLGTAEASTISRQLESEGVPTSDAGDLNGPISRYATRNWKDWFGKLRDNPRAIEVYGEKALDDLEKGVERTARILGDFSLVPEEVKGSPKRSNADPNFPFTMDSTTICPAQDEQVSTIRAIQAERGVLNQAQRYEIGKMIAEAGGRRTCWYCYGQAGRDSAAELVTKAVNIWKGYSDLLARGRRVPEEEIRKVFHAEGKWTYSPGSNLRTGIEKLWRATRDNPELLNDSRIHDIILGYQKADDPTLAAVVRAMKPAVAANKNMPKGFSPYRDQILRTDPAVIERANAIAGIRHNSQTDYRLWHFIELTEMLVHERMKAAMGHAYTKEPAQVDIFGGTGMKFMASLEFIRNADKTLGRDKDGNPAFNNMQGYPWDQAMIDRRRFPRDFGTMVVPMNMEEAWAALEHKGIDMGIPFHAGPIPKDVYLREGAMDFSKWQHEDWGNLNEGDMKRIRLNDGSVLDIEVGQVISRQQHQNSRARYLEIADKLGIETKYPMFKKHRNFMKFVIDVARQPSVQQVVDPNRINWLAAKRWMQKWVNQGGDQYTDKANPIVLEYVKEQLAKQVEQGITQPAEAAQSTQVVGVTEPTSTRYAVRRPRPNKIGTQEWLEKEQRRLLEKDKNTPRFNPEALREVINEIRTTKAGAPKLPDDIDSWIDQGVFWGKRSTPEDQRVATEQWADEASSEDTLLAQLWRDRRSGSDKVIRQAAVTAMREWGKTNRGLTAESGAELQNMFLQPEGSVPYRAGRALGDAGRSLAQFQLGRAWTGLARAFTKFTKAERSDMVFYRERTGNPNVPDDTFQALVARLPDKARRMMDVDFEQWTEKWRKFHGDYGMDAKYRRNYITHFYDQPKGTGKTAEEYDREAMDAVFGKAKAPDPTLGMGPQERQFGEKNPFATPRSFKTYAEALKEAGLRPKYDDVFTIAREQQAMINRNLANKLLHQRLQEVVTADGMPILQADNSKHPLPGWVDITHPAFRMPIRTACQRRSETASNRPV
jgi:hypothetical protein